MAMEGYILTAHAIGLTTRAIHEDLKKKYNDKINALFIENIVRAARQQPRHKYAENADAINRFIVSYLAPTLNDSQSDHCERISRRMLTRGFPSAIASPEKIGGILTKAAIVHATLQKDLPHKKEKWEAAVLTAYEELHYTVNEIVELSGGTEMVSSQVIFVIKNKLGISEANQRRGHSITDWDESEVGNPYLHRFALYGYQVGLTVEDIKTNLNVHGYDFFLANGEFVVSLLQEKGVLRDNC